MYTILGLSRVVESLILSATGGIIRLGERSRVVGFWETLLNLLFSLFNYRLPCLGPLPLLDLYIYIVSL